MDNLISQTKVPTSNENNSTENVVSTLTNESSVIWWTSKELVQELDNSSEQIPLWKIDIDGKSLEITLKLFTPSRPTKIYFLYIDGKSVDYYSKQGNHEILEWWKGIYAKDDIDIDGNTIYMRDGNRRWMKYSIEKKRDDKIGLVLQERLLYNPLKLSTKTRTIGRRKNMTLIEYCNPPERGYIDPDFFKPTEWKLLIIHNRNTTGRDKLVNFPQKEGVTFDENTAENYNYEFYIYDTFWKRYKYDINVVDTNLREINS